MDLALLNDIAVGIEKLAVGSQPELLALADARDAWATIARAERGLASLKAGLAPRIDDAEELARVSGTSVRKAKQVVETAKALQDADVVRNALTGGSISFDQASEIVRAEKASPGAADELLSVARRESFQVLREKSRAVVLEAEQRRGLAERQREARFARHFSDDLGMRNIHLKLPPVLGSAIVNRAEAEAQRLHRHAKREGREEPFERHLADAFAKMLSGSDVKGHCERADVTILVGHGVAKRGWKDVRDGEVCKIPGVGPVAPEVAKEIAEDAFLSGVFFDGKDLRHFKTFGRHARAEVRRALELGTPPEFDGIKCSSCGKRFRNQRDHLEPVAAGGPTSTGNNNWKCYECHLAKTEEDRKAGKLTPPKPDKRGPPGADA
jgi:HNH endonuclease